MSSSEFSAKWAGRFADNDTFQIDEQDLRELAADIAALQESAISYLREGVPSAGDTLSKVYQLLLLRVTEAELTAFASNVSTALAGKQDGLGFVPANKVGDVFTGDVYSTGTGEFGPNAENGGRLVTRSELVNYYNKFSWKRVVRLATQVNVSLSGTPTVDSVASAVGNRILVKAQTNPAENGLYTIPSGGGAWTRAAEADSWDELVNATVFVSLGTNDHDKLFTCTVDEGGTLGTTAVAWMQIGAAPVFQFGAGFTVVGNNVTLNIGVLKNLIGLASAAYLSVPATAGAAASAAEVVRGDDPRLTAVATNTTAIAATTATLAKYDPAFAAVVLAAGTATIATAGKYVCNVTLGLSANTTLALTGLVSGATGTVLVTHDGTSTTYPLTLPAGSRGSVLVGQLAGAVTELSWLYDGTYVNWTSKAY